jgi:TATA-binding protein interacting (TIP20)
VDEGLPLRKAALTCIETILETLPADLDIAGFMPRLVKILEEKEDIKLQAHQILSKLCSYSPLVVLSSVDEHLIKALNGTVTKKTAKEGVVGPEAERAQELVRSGLRTIATLCRLEDINSNRLWVEFIEGLGKLGLVLPEI